MMANVWKFNMLGNVDNHEFNHNLSDHHIFYRLDGEGKNFFLNKKT